MITNNQFDKFRKDFDSLVEHYKETYSVERKIDWSAYEKEYSERLKIAVKGMRSIAEEVNYLLLSNLKCIGRPTKLPYIDKTLMLLLKDIFKVSNRKMANFLSVFSPFTRFETGYKTVERLYSDPIISMIVHNMFNVIITKKDIKYANITGDGTGYSLTVTKHYSTNVKKEDKEGKSFVYSFAFMDINTHLYVGYGTGLRSEKEAFDNAKKMMVNLGIKIDSARLDKYYTYQSIVDEFDKNTKIYILPKSNTTINGSKKWHDIWKSIMYDTMSYLREYYKRENSESGFSGDKRSNGWKVWQKRDDRIRTSLMCKGLWHNLLWYGKN